MGAQVLNFDFEGWKIPDRPLPAPSFADEYLVDARTRNALGKGEQYRFAYPNGYGASVIRGQFTYGGPDLWELAVLKDDVICYTTPITNDVVGYLTEDKVRELLDQIQELP